MNKILGLDSMKEVRESMRALTGKPAKAMAVRLGESHNVSWQYVYKVTEDLRPKRKKRSDRGKRKFEMIPDSDLWKAAALVVGGKLDPDQALLTCHSNNITNLPSLEYFQKILRDHGLGRKQRIKGRRAFRSWEAEFPGEMIQIDVTALKVRWLDENTRRILRIEGIDKNHPNPGENKIRVWQIMAVDDHSRRRFLRYIATTHVTSRDMVEFVCELFCLWGVPLKVYTDNGSEFKGYFVRAEKLLNMILDKMGGYVHERHLPNNSQASGKVEVAHRWAEKMDRYIGLAIAKGLDITFDKLNPFADEICEFYNNRPHRSTGHKPIIRWHGKQIIVRKLPDEIIESALLSDEFEVVLDEAMTVAAPKLGIYKIPGTQPFVNYIGQKVKVVVPPSIDLILLTLPDGSEWEIEKVIATADKAGEFKSHAESSGEQLKKQLKKQFKDDNALAKKQRKLTGETFRVPHFNHKIEQPATNIAHFPHAEHVVTAEEINEVIPIPMPQYTGRPISYWQAVDEFSNRFGSADEAKDFLLGIFPNMQGEHPSSDVESAIDGRHEKPRLLKAV